MTQPAFSPAEVAALLDLSERHVRKEIEHGLLSTGTPPRMEFQALVYFEALRMMDLDLGINDRKKVLTTIRNALVHTRLPETVELSSVLRLEIGALVRDLASTDSMRRMVSKGRLENVAMRAPPAKTQPQYREAFDSVLRPIRRQHRSARGAQILSDTSVARAFSGALQ